MTQFARCPRCNAPELCVIACPNNDALDQTEAPENLAPHEAQLAEDEAIEIVFADPPSVPQQDK